MPEKLEIILNEVDVADLNQLIADFRHADALALTAFLNRRVRRVEQSRSLARNSSGSGEEVGRPE